MKFKLLGGPEDLDGREFEIHGTYDYPEIYIARLPSGSVSIFKASPYYGSHWYWRLDDDNFMYGGDIPGDTVEDIDYKTVTSGVTGHLAGKRNRPDSRKRVLAPLSHKRGRVKITRPRGRGR